MGGRVREAARRLPWLGMLLILGLAVSGISGYFEGVVDELPMLVAFQPLVLGMSGNAGTQSLALTLRALVKNEKMPRRERKRIIIRETGIALLTGLAIGATSFFIVCIYLSVIGKYPINFAATAAGCVGAAMTASMMISGFTGAAIPMLLCRLGVDPAVASGPLITTVSDLCAVISYYSLAWVLLINI